MVDLCFPNVETWRQIVSYRMWKRGIYQYHLTRPCRRWPAKKLEQLHISFPPRCWSEVFILVLVDIHSAWLRLPWFWSQNFPSSTTHRFWPTCQRKYGLLHCNDEFLWPRGWMATFDDLFGGDGFATFTACLGRGFIYKMPHPAITWNLTGSVS